MPGRSPTKLLGGNQVVTIGEEGRGPLPWSPEAGPEWTGTRTHSSSLLSRHAPLSFSFAFFSRACTHALALTCSDLSSRPVNAGG
ncbi:hypothetical protein HDV63DRAFT_369442 [Trichoderma sp. SZMC 28014]